MTQETKDYIESWTKKISTYKGEGLGDLFDKYTALFTLYNRLYNESFKEMKSKGTLTKGRYSDFDKATKLVVEFNSAQDIIDRIYKNGNLKDTQKIAELIRNDIFHINLADGVSKKGSLYYN